MSEYVCLCVHNTANLKTDGHAPTHQPTEPTEPTNPPTHPPTHPSIHTHARTHTSSTKDAWFSTVEARFAMASTAYLSERVYACACA